MSFTSSVYIKTSGHTNEMVCVGLFAISGSNRYFSYSAKKIRIADTLIEEKLFKGLEDSLKRIKKEITLLNSDSIFGLDERFNESSWKYLNNYSKGLFYFDKLKPLDLELTDESFDKLFDVLVGFKNDEPRKVVNFTSRIKSILKEEAFNKIDLEYPISTNIINTYAPHKVDFIGKNGSLVVGQAIDFNHKPVTIDKSLGEYARIVRGLRAFSSTRSDVLGSGGTYKAYFEFPDDHDSRRVLDLALADCNKGYDLEELDKLEIFKTTLENGTFVKFSSLFPNDI